MTNPEKKTKTPPDGELAHVLAVLKANTILLAFFFGLCFVAALLVLAVWFPEPTAFQYTVFRITLALAAAGIAGVIPGMIRLKMQPGAMLIIHAGGALAVFVIVYLFAPAALPPEQPAPPSPPPKEKPEKRVKLLQQLKISNVDAIENGVHILTFTPPGAVHIARISNIGDTAVSVSLIGFPEQYFYTNLLHEGLIIQGHSVRNLYIVLTCNLPAQKEYIFQINDSAGGTAQVAIRLNKGWEQYLARQIQYLRYKNNQGASTAELHQDAKQLISASGAQKLAPPLQEALAGQLLVAADYPEVAAIAYAKAEEEAPEIAERFIVNSSPDVMTALAELYKRVPNSGRKKYWQNFSAKTNSIRTNDINFKPDEKQIKNKNNTTYTTLNNKITQEKSLSNEVAFIVEATECKAVWREEQEEYVFVLQNCSRSDTQISCYMLITSKGQNREMTIQGTDKTRIVDNFGRSHKTSSIKSEIYTEHRRLRRIFFADTPTNVIVSFTNVPKEVNNIAVFYLEAYDETGRSNNRFEISDISFCNDELFNNY